MTTSTHSRNSIGGSGGPSVVIASAYSVAGYLTQVRSTAANRERAHWSVLAQDAEQRVRRARLGNGLVTQASFSDYSGRLAALAGGPDDGAGWISNATVQNDSYLYDALANLSLRTQLIDSSGALSMESFGYDDLRRLTASQVVGQSAKSFSYDAIGNLVSKSGIGSYSYPASGSSSIRPHAVAAISGSVLGVANPAFSYDGNGNFSAGGGRSVSWKSFNAPYVISRGAASVTLAYGPEAQRAKQTVSSGTVITYGGAIEKEQSGSTKIKTYLPRGLGFIEESGSSALARYFHRDHLGSVSAVSDEAGSVLERLSYDAWGKRRYLNGADAPDTLSAAIDRTGYSGAEALDSVNLVHLNGRVYDPLVGHLISADPTVSDASDGQALNRYAYGLNNPLAYTDPSGYTAIQRNDSPPPKMQWEEGAEKETQRLERVEIVGRFTLVGAVTTRLRATAAPTGSHIPVRVVEVRQGYLFNQLQSSGRASRLGMARSLTDPYFAAYDRAHPNFHDYGVGPSFGCYVGDGLCSVSTVSAIVNSEAVPFSFGPSSPGSQSILGMWPINNYSPAPNLSINDTLSGHWFHPGSVAHVTFETDRTVWFYSRGVGIGANPAANIAIGTSLFGKMHFDVQSRIRLELLGRPGP